MIIKWHKNVVKINNMQIKLGQEVLNAGVFKNWYVIATKTTLQFMGKDPYIFSIPLICVVFTDTYIYYHSREDKNIYKLSHPLEEEVFLFYSPQYVLINVIIHDRNNNIENPIYILALNRNYIIKKRKTYFLHLIKLKEKIEHMLRECSFEEFIGMKSVPKVAPDDELQLNIEDSKEGIDLLSKVNSSLDDKILNMIVEDNFNIQVYGDYLVVLCNNLVTFVNFINFTERNIDLINTAKSITYVFDELIEIYRPLKVLKSNQGTDFVQINDHLFYKTELIHIINKKIHPKAFKKNKLESKYCSIFWKKPNAIDKQVMEILSPNDLIRLIVQCIETTVYDFKNIGLSFTQETMINEFLELDLLRFDSLESFIKTNDNYMIMNNIPFIRNIRELYQQESYISLSDDYNTLLDIKYERIFSYNSKILSNLRFKSIKNLAYQIIFLELNKDNELKDKKSNIRKKWKKYRKIFYRKLNDARMDEVELLFNEKPKEFNFESKAENINEKAYVLRLSCNFGRSLAFYDSVKQEDKTKSIEVVYPMYKDTGVVNIEIKEKNWKNWPSFHYACYSFLSSPSLDNISFCFLENWLKTENKKYEESEHILAGMFYASGLRGGFKNIRFEDVINLTSNELPLASMVILISMGLASKGVHNFELYEALTTQLTSETHPYIKLGYYIGVSYTYMNSKNINLRNMLIKEINNIEAFNSEKYNKGNIMCYDETYRLTLGFMLAYVFRDKNHKPYEYMVFQDKLLELLVNGLISFNSKNQRHLNKLRRSKDDSPEEMFYSELFILGCSCISKCNEICAEIRSNLDKLEISDIYKFAGKCFYIGTSELINRILTKEDIIELHELCLILEEKMLIDEKYRTLFDYCLISLCLIQNSTCDLNLIKIIRRQIKRTEKNIWDRNKNDYVFTVKGMIKETQTTLTYGQIEKYKLCLGVLCLGLSRYKIEPNINTIIDLVITFYVKFSICTQDQDYFNILRYNIFNSIVKNRSSCLYMICKFKNENNKSKEVSFYFRRRFKSLSEFDKKFVIDVLSDYYENYHKGDFLIDIEHFKKKVIHCS